MKFIAGFIIVAFLVASSKSSTTPFTKCLDGPMPSDVRVKGCTKTPCVLRRGTIVHAEWDFIIPQDTKKLTPHVRATVMGVTVTYPFPQKDACATLKNAKCPLHPGEAVTYTLSMPIKRFYPNVQLAIEFAFLDDSNKAAVCFVLAARVA